MSKPLMKRMKLCFLLNQQQDEVYEEEPAYL